MKKLILLLLCAANAAATTTYSSNLSWTASTTASVSYNIYRGNVSGACSPVPPLGSSCVLLNTVPLSTLTFKDSGLIVGSSYFYVVRAVNSSGIESLNSTEGKADLTQPNIPGGVTVTVTVTVTTP